MSLRNAIIAGIGLRIAPQDGGYVPHMPLRTRSKVGPHRLIHLGHIQGILAGDPRDQELQESQESREHQDNHSQVTGISNLRY
ncbi:hypothetical protein GX50_04827 [[Emmonsia] crescens]|uniref:Uncharacterized protein n=1 Tax=[Emmonsia] crescens TaxID=73230 RepID=A0A2B7ZHC6_9EURO|nr:hypothetical protein GX50_04827 [Emmonsia crescens]